MKRLILSPTNSNTWLRTKLDASTIRRILHGEGIKYEGLGIPPSETDMTIQTLPTVPKELNRLSHGNILLVGVKASNFDNDIKNHPRIIMWDSQDQRWTHNDVPHNVRAIFMTRFVGHTIFDKIVKEARKKQITIFNPQGTGMIVKQVKELLDMPRPALVKPLTEKVETKPMTTATETKSKTGGATVKGHSKLNVLMQYLDSSKTVIENARFMYEKAKELGIDTTVGSIAQKVSVANRRRPYMERPGAQKKAQYEAGVPTRIHKHVDVVVEILDNMVKELQDMREFLVATTEENKTLKSRIDNFKKMLGD